MPEVDSNGLQRRNFTGSHNLRKQTADHFVLGVSTLLEALLASSNPDLLGMKKSKMNLMLGARSSAKMTRDLGLEPRVVCTYDGVFPTSMSILLELVALTKSFIL